MRQVNGKMARRPTKSRRRRRRRDERSLPGKQRSHAFLLKRKPLLPRSPRLHLRRARRMRRRLPPNLQAPVRSLQAADWLRSRQIHLSLLRHHRQNQRFMLPPASITRLISLRSLPQRWIRRASDNVLRASNNIRRQVKVMGCLLHC